MPWHRYSFTGRFFAVNSTAAASNLVHESKTKISINLFKAIFLMAIDIVLCLVVTVSTYYFISWFIFIPYDRGFHCDDVSIRNDLYPNTVPTMHLLTITLGLPLLIIFLSTTISTYEATKKQKSSSSCSQFFQIHFQYVIRKTTFVYLNYIIGFFILTMSLDIIKCYVGRLRPNFIAMCKPANLTICDKDPHAYVVESMCTADWKKSRNSRMSFPSGHSAATIFALVFIIKYLFGLQHSSAFNARLFRYTTIILYGAFSAFCCISRVTDFWHFPTDVLGGIFFAIILFYLTLRKYL